MRPPAVFRRWRQAHPATLAAAVVTAVVTVALYTRFSINERLWRDESIYVYGAQRFAHGVPPYVSVFDPKAPLATILAGVAAAVSRLLSWNDIYAVRAEFFVFSCLTVLALYGFASRLWRSPAAGVLAAAVFVSFPIFAQDAIGGPDAKTPAVLFMVVAMWLLMERRWFWAGMASAAAVLVWQPLFILPIVALALPLVTTDPSGRRRAFGLALAGVALPTTVIGLYFLATGAFGKLIEATVVFPLTGNHRVPLSLHERLTHMPHVIRLAYGRGETLLLEGGLVALLVICAASLFIRRSRWRTAIRHPLVSVVLLTFVFVLGFLVYYDFQGPEDTLALTPYAALGVSGVATLVLRLARGHRRTHRALIATVVAVAAVIAGLAWPAFDHRPTHNDVLLAEYSDTCAIDRMLGTTGQLYALGDPTPLVISHRRNPDRFIYLEENVSGWKIRHTPGGFDGWVAQIMTANPAVIVLQTWGDANAQRLKRALLAAGYASAWVGGWHVYLQPSAQALAATNDVQLTDGPTPVAEDLQGAPLPRHNCTQPSS